MPQNAAAIGLAFKLCILPLVPAIAGSLQVGPTRVSLADSNSVESITVRNAGDADMIVQLEKFAWRQREGSDEYEPTDELIATPPVFRMPAGGVQIVRVGVRGPAEADAQRAFRLYVREVPSSLTSSSGGLRVALRIGVPVFQGVPQAASDSLVWLASRTQDGRVAITADNAAQAFVHVVGLQLCPVSGGECIWQSREGGYVLAHGSRAWIAPVSLGSDADTRMRLLVKTDEQSFHRDLMIKR